MSSADIKIGTPILRNVKLLPSSHKIGSQIIPSMDEYDWTRDPRNKNNSFVVRASKDPAANYEYVAIPNDRKGLVCFLNVKPPEDWTHLFVTRVISNGKCVVCEPVVGNKDDLFSKFTGTMEDQYYDQLSTIMREPGALFDIVSPEDLFSGLSLDDMRLLVKTMFDRAHPQDDDADAPSLEESITSSVSGLQEILNKLNRLVAVNSTLSESEKTRLHRVTNKLSSCRSDIINITNKILTGAAR